MAPAARAYEPAFGAAVDRRMEEVERLGSYRLPIAPWSEGGMATRTAEGEVRRMAVTLRARGQTTLEIMAPLRAQLQQDGYLVVFECEAFDCGGFDFRFAIDVLPEPEMHVDLGDYRFLAAERGGEVVSLLVSRSAEAGFVQLVRVAPAGGAGAMVASTKAAPPPAGLEAVLSEGAGAVLAGLVFAPGRAVLEAGGDGAVEDLAAWLAADPARRVVLRGHTDSSGDAQANLALSAARAEAVRALLVDRHGIAPARIAAEGVGDAEPMASNATPEGRAANRRVEVRAAGG
jgi:OOP family OmpA-OmpF porin